MLGVASKISLQDITKDELITRVGKVCVSWKAWKCSTSIFTVFIGQLISLNYGHPINKPTNVHSPLWQSHLSFIVGTPADILLGTVGPPGSTPGPPATNTSVNVNHSQYLNVKAKEDKWIRIQYLHWFPINVASYIYY